MFNERNIGSLEDVRASLFLERYQRLLSRAMRLTNRDRWVAEDLVQEAFIQFIRGRTSVDANAIQKLCGLAQANNETIRAAFTISGQRLNVGLNSERFWKDLIDAQQIAGAIEKY